MRSQLAYNLPPLQPDLARCVAEASVMRREYVDKTVEKWGRIDILVNNAAFQGPAKDSFADIERERLEFTFKTSE